MIRLLSLVLFVGLAMGVGAGCGSSGSGSSGSSPGDLALAPDLANGFVCGATSCGGAQKCCIVNATPTCASSCPDGGFTAECKGPENCGGNPCCITIGSGFNVQSVACATGASACAPAVNAGTQSGMDRACHVDADCIAGLPTMPAPQLPDCCTNAASGQHVCFNKSLVGVVPGWTCP